MVVAAFGGYVSCISLSRTTLNYAAGGRGRLSGLVVAIVSVLVLTANPSFLAYIPKFVLSGMLLYLGFNLIREWLIDSARRISLLEYASLLAIALLIIQVGFIAGVLIGVIIGCATFALSASRINTVKFSFDGSEYRSTLDREPAELAILAAHGHEIQGMSLQNYLFFGSANRLYQQVKALFAAKVRLPFPAVRFSPRHRHRLFCRTQLHANQAGRRRARCPPRPGRPFSGAAHEVQLPHLEGRECRRRSRPGLGGLREGSDLGPFARWRRREGLARMVHPGARQCRLRRATYRLLPAARGAPG